MNRQVNKTALLVGYYGVGNLGDELMLVCLKDWLSRQGISVTVAAQVPESVEAMHNVPAVPNLPLFGQWDWVPGYLRGRIFPLWKALLSSDMVVIGGGDLIRDDVGGKTFLYSIEKMLVATILRKPVHLVNVGIGEPSTRWRRFVLGLLLRRCRTIIVRDPGSLRLCSRYSVTRATLAPDIVFELPRMIASQPTGEQRTLLVCLRGDANVYGRFRLDETRLSNLAAALDHLVDKYNLTVRFIPFQSSLWGDDNLLHQQVRDKMAFGERTEIVPWEFHVERLVAAFAEARCVVAMRLHAGVLAAALGRPVIMLPYDRKVAEFAEFLKVPSLEADILNEQASTVKVIEGALVTHPATVALGWNTLGLSDHKE